MGKAGTLLMLYTAGLAGCGWFSDDKGFFVNRSDDYIDARQVPELIIPEDLGRDLEDPFPIPPIPAQQNSRFFPGRPPLPNAIYADDNRQEIRIQKLGERIWLVLPESPTTVWPKIKQFLAENGVSVASEQVGQGRITTEWLVVEKEAQYRDVVRTLLQEERASTDAGGGRDRLLIQVEQGLRDLTSEVHIRHQNEGANLAQQPADLQSVASGLAALEGRVLNELGAYIAARVAEQTVSMVAQEITGKAKSELDRDASGQPVLRLFLDEERAWATMNQAFINAGVEVLTTNRATGAFHVRVPETAFLGPDQKPGFFRRMFSFGGGDVQEVMVRVRQKVEQVFELSIEPVDGKAVPFEFAQRLLVLVREYAA